MRVISHIEDGAVYKTVLYNEGSTIKGGGGGGGGGGPRQLFLEDQI